jgi:NADPH-dependent 2,4-dienoyl-CoA reductase/sulfur reductase-like enzyme
VGCTVFLIEKEDHLGGLSTFISDLPDKRRMKDFPKYLVNRAKKLHNLFVFLNTEANMDLIKSLNPDVIVNSTGSAPLVPPIKGLRENIAEGNVCTIFDMINNYNAGKYPDEFCKGKKVVVMGGGAVGLDVIEYFAPRGAECTIVDMLPGIGMLSDPITKCSMRELHDKYHVKEMTRTALQEVKPNAFTVKLPDGTITDLEFDLGFNCLGMRANNPILPELEKEFGEDEKVFIYNIGDSVRARRILEGTMEGRAVLNVLDYRGFLDLTSPV